MASQPTVAPPTPTPQPPPPPPPQPPSSAKQGFLRRIFPLLILTNLAVGVYVLTRTSQKDKKKEESTTEIKAPEKKPPEIAPAPAPLPVKELPPIPPEEQLQLFKWILQEKRKVKTRDPVEKKKIDEEKALLKEIIRSGSLPSL
ncbi:uncharacterized protein LOC144562607 [Carex rostrata]